MNQNRGVFIAIAAIVFAAVVGFVAYQAGVQQGIVQSGKLVVQQAPAPGPYPYPYYGWHPWGFGFFFGPLIVLFLFFGLLRAILWRGRYYRHHHACGYAPPEGGAPQQQ